MKDQPVFNIKRIPIKYYNPKFGDFRKCLNCSHSYVYHFREDNLQETICKLCYPEDWKCDSFIPRGIFE
ncbi:MAG: hypothetical protein AABY22_03145 [Nanoarchaeota archaeon]